MSEYTIVGTLQNDLQQRRMKGVSKSQAFIGIQVIQITSQIASKLAVQNHYLQRRPPILIAFGLWQSGMIRGICTFGVPPSRHLQKSACPSNPSCVIELNRLWVDDSMQKNSESWFVSRCLSQLWPCIVVSYADTEHMHRGYVYRALNWKFAGVTDEDRKTPRFDYLIPEKHSRSTFRSGDGANAEKVRRKPKYKYWTVTGDRRQRRALAASCGWPDKSWKAYDERISLHEMHP